MRSLARFALLVTAVVFTVSWPSLAQEWSPPVPIAPPLLAYGATYATGVGTRTHGGTDLAAEPGEAVRAVAPGTVAFAGSVPSAEGGCTFAVTLDLGAGLRATFMPFSRLDVGRGDTVAGGDRLGELAAHGDASSSASHLHVGATLNGARIDPASLLPTAPPAEEQPAQQEPAGEAAQAADASTGRIAAAAPAPAAAAAALPAARAAAPNPAAAGQALIATTSRPSPAQPIEPVHEPSPTPSVGDIVASRTTPTAAGRPVPASSSRVQADALMSIAARATVAQERSVSPARLPDVSALGRLRSLAARIAAGLAGAAVSAVGFARVARARRFVAAPVRTQGR